MGNPFTLSGKTILVTGASSGIGKAISIEISRMGARVILLGRNQNSILHTLNSMESGDHEYALVDLVNQEEVDTFIKQQCPVLDGIVHSAGMGLTLPFKFTSAKELNRVMDINFTAPVLLTQKLIKNRRVNKEASIIYISSIDGVITGHVGNSIYSASKGALYGMAKSQAVELAKQRIRVNCILPGRVDTALIERTNISSDQVDKNKELYPLGRYGKPEEIAYYAIYLLSDASSFTTGSALVIDGGFTLL